MKKIALLTIIAGLSNLVHAGTIAWERDRFDIRGGSGVFLSESSLGTTDTRSASLTFVFANIDQNTGGLAAAGDTLTFNLTLGGAGGTSTGWNNTASGISTRGGASNFQFDAGETFTFAVSNPVYFDASTGISHNLDSEGVFYRLGINDLRNVSTGSFGGNTTYSGTNTSNASVSGTATVNDTSVIALGTTNGADFINSLENVTITAATGDTFRIGEIGVAISLSDSFLPGAAVPEISNFTIVLSFITLLAVVFLRKFIK